MKLTQHFFFQCRVKYDSYKSDSLLLTDKQLLIQRKQRLIILNKYLKNHCGYRTPLGGTYSLMLIYQFYPHFFPLVNLNQQLFLRYKSLSLIIRLFMVEVVYFAM